MAGGSSNQVESGETSVNQEESRRGARLVDWAQQTEQAGLVYHQDTRTGGRSGEHHMEKSQYVTSGGDNGMERLSVGNHTDVLCRML